jgi:hypothetical protein
MHFLHTNTQANVLGEVLPNPPTDGISQLKFSQFTNTLVASSWDKVDPIAASYPTGQLFVVPVLAVLEGRNPNLAHQL